MRTASGIAVVAVMSKPHRCPHIATTGNICVYCPGGPDSDFEYSTQSYTGYEPTSMRAIRARYVNLDSEFPTFSQFCSYSFSFTSAIHLTLHLKSLQLSLLLRSQTMSVEGKCEVVSGLLSVI